MFLQSLAVWPLSVSYDICGCGNRSECYDNDFKKFCVLCLTIKGLCQDCIVILQYKFVQLGDLLSYCSCVVWGSLLNV